MSELNEAQKLIQSWYFGGKPAIYYKHTHATPHHSMRKGEDGSRKAGGYGKGLRNWITNKQAAIVANKKI